MRAQRLLLFSKLLSTFCNPLDEKYRTFVVSEVIPFSQQGSIIDSTCIGGTGKLRFFFSIKVIVKLYDVGEQSTF